MFEKEAEKWVENNLHSTEEDYIKAFKDGAEFGYNKANEWHYVKDGDLPKENKKYWILTSNREPKVDSWLNVSWVDSYDVIAWKEIALPELKEQI